MLRSARALAVAAAVFGCAPGAPPTGEGHADLDVELSGSTAVARVTVTVSGGDGPPFSPSVLELSGSGTSWSGSITGLPAGPGRQFDAVALDANGGTLYSGWAKSDIEAGATALLSIGLGAPPPPPFGNSMPVIDYLAVSAIVVGPGATARVGTLAHDPDPGDAVSYLWGSTCGALDAPSSAEAQWTAPDIDGTTCDLTIDVSDGRGGSVAAAVTVAVTAAGTVSH